MPRPSRNRSNSSLPAGMQSERLEEEWCRWSGSNRHSLREHDFESCASANSATPAAGALIAALGSHANGRFQALAEGGRLRCMSASFTLFETPVGFCGLVWGEHGICGVDLPGRDQAATRARLLRRHPGAKETPPPADIAAARDAIVALLKGENRDLSDITLDTRDLPALNR